MRRTPSRTGARETRARARPVWVAGPPAPPRCRPDRPMPWDGARPEAPPISTAPSGFRREQDAHRRPAVWVEARPQSRRTGTSVALVTELRWRAPHRARESTPAGRSAGRHPDPDRALARTTGIRRSAERKVLPSGMREAPGMRDPRGPGGALRGRSRQGWRHAGRPRLSDRRKLRGFSGTRRAGPTARLGPRHRESVVRFRPPPGIRLARKTTAPRLWPDLAAERSRKRGARAGGRRPGWGMVCRLGAPRPVRGALPMSLRRALARSRSRDAPGRAAPGENRAPPPSESGHRGG